MSGETIVVKGTTKTLESAGASIANGSLVKSTTAYDQMGSDGNGYPDAVFVLAATFASAPVEGAVLALYARPMDIDGTLDSEIPETTRPTRFIGTFVVNNVTSLQVMELLAYDVPSKAEYYVHNNGTGIAVNTGWTLKVTPRTYKAAP